MFSTTTQAARIGRGSSEGRVLEITLSSCHHHPTNHASVFERTEGEVHGISCAWRAARPLHWPSSHSCRRICMFDNTVLRQVQIDSFTPSSSYELDEDIRPIEPVSNISKLRHREPLSENLNRSVAFTTISKALDAHATLSFHATCGQ